MTMTNYKTLIPESVQEYLDIIEQEEEAMNEERKLFAKFIRKVFKEEELFYDNEQIEKYFSYQKYFPFELLPWEKCLFVLAICLFKKDGSLRFSELLGIMGRGAGKNGFLSYILFCLITPTHGIRNYHIDIIGNSEDQAKVSFNELYDVMNDPKNSAKLRKHFKWNKTEITNLKTNSTIRYNTANPKTKDGRRPGALLFDEIHAYENWENLEVHITGMGKVAFPRTWYISSFGDVREGPFDKMLERGIKILKGELADNGLLPFICRLSDKEKVHDEKNWEEANPSVKSFPVLKEQMRKEYQNYIIDPTNNSSFMTKRMGIPQGRKDTEVASWENILATNKPVPDLAGKTCVCGIDFAKTTDFVSVFLLFKEEEKYYGIHHSWFCANSNDKHRIKIPLPEMVERGLLTMVDDVEINPTLIADWIYEQSLIYNIEKIAIDNFRYSLLSRALKEVGFDAKEKRVKLIRPSDIMMIHPKINSVFVSQQLSVGDDPLFRWFTNNTKSVPAPNGNSKYDKIEPKSRKTDGFMAFVAAMTLENELPDMQELIFFDPIIL